MTSRREKEIRSRLKKLNVGIFEVHPMLEELLAEIDRLRADLIKATDDLRDAANLIDPRKTVGKVDQPMWKLE